MAAKIGAEYETELATKLWDKYKLTSCNASTPSPIYKTLEPETAGSSSGSDLAGITEWTINGNGQYIMKLNIEVKNIKGIGKCTSGLDFGQYTLVYILNKVSNNGIWFPNVTGQTWNAINGKNQSLIRATVNALNKLDSTNSQLPPRPSAENLDIWSIASPTKRNKILDESMDWDVKNQDIIVIQGLKEEYYRPPNSLFGNVFTLDALPIKERPVLEARWAGCILAMKGPNKLSDIVVPNDTANAMLADIKNYYATKGDDLIQIKNYGLFTLKSVNQYNTSPFAPPVPKDWYDDRSFDFVNYILNDNNTSIQLRLRNKYHGKSSSSFRDWTCAIKFNFNKKLNSKYTLDNDNNANTLVDYWCEQFKSLSFALSEETEDNIENIFSDVTDGSCSIMGGNKKRKTMKKRKKRKSKMSGRKTRKGRKTKSRR